MKLPRRSPETLLVLEKFIEHPGEWRYGYELGRETAIKSGTLYPILMRLEKYSLLESKWVAMGEGVPARHTFRLTPNGVELAQTEIARSRSQPLERQPAFCTG